MATEAELVDELALVDGNARANELDRNTARQKTRRKLIDLGRRLTTIRVALDDAFEALNESSAELDDDERRQLDADEQFRKRRHDAQQRSKGD